MHNKSINKRRNKWIQGLEIAETFQTWMQRLMNSVEDHKSFEQVIVLYQKIVFMESNSPSDKQLFKKLLKDCAIAIKRSQKNL